MNNSDHTPASIAERLLAEPPRGAGIDGHGQPVRLGETDSQGYLVGYIDDNGLAWESLTERLVAIHAGRLAEALALSPSAPRRNQLMVEILIDVPDQLIADVAQNAVEQLWLSARRPLP